MATPLPNVAPRGPKGDPGAPGLPLVAVSASPIKFITPATTFTGLTVSDNGAGKVLLTGAGSHGLLSADAIGASIYITSGAGWAGGLTKIIALDADNGNQIALDVPYAVQGVPSITLGSTQTGFTLAILPALGNDSVVRADISLSFKSSANAKEIAVRTPNSADLWRETNLLNIVSYRLLFIMQNRGSPSSQVGLAKNMAGGIGSSVDALFESAQDYSTARVFRLALKPSPGEPIIIEKYVIESFV